MQIDPPAFPSSAPFIQPTGVDRTALLVRITVVSSCAMRAGSAATVLNFGEITATGGPVIGKVDREPDAIRVACSSPTSVPRVSIGPGGHAAGTQRHMANGPVRVSYDLFRDPAMVVPRVPGVFYAMPFRSPDAPEHVGIYGRVPAPIQASLAGAYADSVLITVSY